MVPNNSRPFAHNTGSTISETTQIGNLAVGNVDLIRYDLNYGGVKWWMGPYETNNYIIAVPLDGPTEPTPDTGVYEWFSFSESTDKTDN